MVTKRYDKVIEIFPPNVPPDLIAAYKDTVEKHRDQGGYQRKLARKLGVNMKYLNDLIIKGIEPTSRTAKGRAAREKLFLKNDNPLQNKEEVVEALEGIVKHLQNTISRMR